MATLAPLGPVEAYDWEHRANNKKRTLLSTGTLWCEKTQPFRMFFEVHLIVDGFVTISYSGWHGRYDPYCMSDKRGIYEFELKDFRYSGYGYDAHGEHWYHCMKFRWNGGINCYTNIHCNCFTDVDDGKHKGIRVRRLYSVTDLVPPPPSLSTMASLFSSPPPPRPVSFPEPPPPPAPSNTDDDRDFVVVEIE